MSAKTQRQVLIGLQSVAGTGVNVDVALRAAASLKAVPDKVIVEENIGSFAPTRHYIGSLSAEGEIEYDGYYEHVPYIVSMAMGAGSVVPGTTPLPDVWTFSLANASAPTFALYTMEYADGANHIVRGVDVIATALEISGEAGQSWMFKPTLVGGQVTFPSAVSATPSVSATATQILMSDTSIFMDALYTNIGTTVMNQLISFNWKLEEYFHTKLFAGSLWPTGRGVDRWKVSLEIVAEVENAVIESIKDTLMGVTQTAIRIKADAGVSEIAIDGNYMLSEVDTLDDRDGNNIISMTFLGERDSSGNTGSIVASVPELAAL